MLNRKEPYLVLIAEDELLVRVGINLTVPWADFNMDVIGLAEDGISAWKLYQQHSPALVLTDIRMPGLDGIELVQRIRQENQTCEIIIITCLEDFDILYQLMQMRITGYLLKATMTKAEMEKLIKKAWQNLETLADSDDKPAPVSVINQTKMDLTTDLAKGDEHPADWQLGEDTFITAQLCLALRFTGEQSNLLKSVVIEIFQRRLLPTETGRVFTTKDLSLFVFFHYTAEQHESFTQNIEELTLYVQEIFSVDLRLATLRINERLDRLDWLLETATSVLDNTYFFPDNYHYLDLTTTKQPLNPQLRLSLLFLQEKVMARLPALIFQQKRGLLKDCFEQLEAALLLHKDQFNLR